MVHWGRPSLFVGEKIYMLTHALEFELHLVSSCSNSSRGHSCTGSSVLCATKLFITELRCSKGKLQIRGDAWTCQISGFGPVQFRFMSCFPSWRSKQEITVKIWLFRYMCAWVYSISKQPLAVFLAVAHIDKRAAASSILPNFCRLQFSTSTLLFQGGGEAPAKRQAVTCEKSLFTPNNAKRDPSHSLGKHLVRREMDLAVCTVLQKR